MKRILISLSIIGVVAAIAIGVTVALFSDTETSAGNIFVAGTMDLKVDHLKQTYRDLECNTASVQIQSDTTNQVTGQIGGIDLGPFPHPAVLVSPPLNASWTASIPGASWVWWTDPTPEVEKGVDTTYTFQKTFNWMGPISGATLNLYVGADNSYQIFLNGSSVGADPNEWNFTTSTQDTYSGVQISPYIVQGQNVLEIKVKNWARPQGQTWDNPGGLLYKLVINGNPTGDYFKAHCQLWGETDLTDETFFDFDDVKPGDWGTNLISLHENGNDAWACLFADKTGVDPEEISNDLNVVVWSDNGNGMHEAGETILYNGKLIDTDIPVAVPPGSPIGEDLTIYVGLAWCFGTQTADTNTALISCSGSSVGNNAQGDTLTAILTAYAEQWRNNPNFNCASVELPIQ